MTILTSFSYMVNGKLQDVEYCKRFFTKLKPKIQNFCGKVLYKHKANDWSRTNV